MEELNKLSNSKFSNESNESEFYNFIVGITKYSNCENLLRKDSQSIFEVITKDYKKNIHLAASRGLNKAYICIYEISARYKGLIPIDAFIRPNELMKEKLETFNIESVVDKLKKKLYPFNIEIKNINESELQEDLNIPEITVDSIIRSNVMDIDFTTINSELNDKKNIKNINNLIGIMVIWEKNK